jgi:NADH-quinone oxidoreductase subunit J
MADLIIFVCLAIFIVVMSVMAVTSGKILRAATYLLFVLIGTAGLYLMLNYHFLAAVQISVYAGGIVVLFIFAIFLTSNKGDMVDNHNKKRILYGVVAAVAGVTLTGFALLKHEFLNYLDNPTITGDREINMKMIGQALMGTEKYQYLLPFEILSVLLLACIIGGILIARKR